jgi:hypothetical protein
MSIRNDLNLLLGDGDLKEVINTKLQVSEQSYVNLTKAEETLGKLKEFIVECSPVNDDDIVLLTNFAEHVKSKGNDIIATQLVNIVTKLTQTKHIIDTLKIEYIVQPAVMPKEPPNTVTPFKLPIVLPNPRDSKGTIIPLKS